MKPHIVKFLRFLEDNEGKYLPIKFKLLNQVYFNFNEGELNVDGDLDLSFSKITTLPDGLWVGLSLDLSDCTSLTTLPDGLHINRVLILNGCTSLTALPDGLKVGGDLYLRKTSIAEVYSVDEIRSMVEASGGYVGGNIYI